MVRIKENLEKVSKNAIGHIKNLEELIETREKERVFYDHYRTKLAKMEKPGKESSSQNPDD